MTRKLDKFLYSTMYVLSIMQTCKVELMRKDKGQLISKGDLKVFIWTKKQMLIIILDDK